MKFSVLISVYFKETPTHLSECLESLIHQTVKANEIILVEDGKLNDGLYDVINRFSEKFHTLKIVSYEENMGLGYALQHGLQHCSHELVARMDADDICYPERFEKELDIFQSHPEIAVVSSWISTFSKDISQIENIKTIPEFDHEIKEYAISRNPVNHPACMFRKSKVLEAGNYKPFYLLEDYYLWIRMINKGYIFYNIQEPLVYFRQSNDTFERRGGIRYIQSDIRLQTYAFRSGFINIRQYIRNLGIRVFVRLVPNKIRKYLYLFFLRDRQ